MFCDLPFFLCFRMNFVFFMIFFEDYAEIFYDSFHPFWQVVDFVMKFMVNMDEFWAQDADFSSIQEFAEFLEGLYQIRV